MRVWLSRRAINFIRQETAYLRHHSPSAADRFLTRVGSVRRDLARFAKAGFSEEGLPIPDMRRFVRDGYRYDYLITNGELEITEISSSVNTPLANPSDDGDFEEKPKR